MESTASFKSHHLRAGRAKSTTTLEPELWVQRCELRVTVSQRTEDDNILCGVFCVPVEAVPPRYSCMPRRRSRSRGSGKAGPSYHRLRIRASLAMPKPSK